MSEVPEKERRRSMARGGIGLTAASRAAVAVGVQVFLPSSALHTSNQSTAPWPVDQIDGQTHALLHSFTPEASLWI